MSPTINEIVEVIHETAIDHGWWEPNQDGYKRTRGESIALMHSELSEALEEIRLPDGMPLRFEGFKPEGWAIELLDCVIRILDFIRQEAPDLDIERALLAKMEYNRTRPYRHGGKLL